MVDQFTDEELIAALQEDNAKREAALRFLCKNEALRNVAFKTINGLLLEKETATEVFHDSILLFLKNLKTGKFQKRSSVRSYIVGICKKLCLQRNERHLKNTLRKKLLPFEEEEKNNPENILLELEKDRQWAQLQRKVYRMLSETCRKILRAFYQYKKPLVEIAEQMGWAGSNTAKKNMYRCRNKLREYILQDEEAIRIIKSRL